MNYPYLNYKKSYKSFVESGETDYDKKHFDEWKGYSLLCPKLTDEITLYGTDRSMYSSSMIF